jgi:hypothetical protein
MPLKTWAEQLQDHLRVKPRVQLDTEYLLRWQHGKGHSPGARTDSCPACKEEAERAALQG